MGERIQKVLARAGIGSRRAVEGWIAEGRVRVNGQPVEPGAALERDDRVEVDGRRYQVVAAARRPARWLRYHKPVGEVSTRDDPENRPTVFDRLPKLREAGGRWVSLGRLDIATSGLMLFTDDGTLANALTHPSREVEREYAVRVHGQVPPETLQRLQQGIELDDGPARFDRVADVGGEGSNHWYHVVLHEGRQNEVRRLWEAVGCQVARLTRVRFGPVTLPRHLRQGKFEDLPPAEVRALEQIAGGRGDGGGLTLQPWTGKRRGRPGPRRKAKPRSRAGTAATARKKTARRRP
ncbi:MAG: pseudouridine synthase [Halofilum sp. (in: g-proteobacteria)]|nr:pseudouridine synthase [Halofilum sp. (in: g-proteobacteria)]